MVAAVPGVAHAQDSLAVARDLYASAAYEDALTVLNRLDSSPQAQDRLAVNQYRAFCLLALRRTAEADQAIEAVLSAQPFYHPSEAEASPRLLSAFAAVRQRILPAILQKKYAHAKETYDNKDFAGAAIEFDQVLHAFDDPDLGDAGSRAPLSDLRTLAAGFRDLSVRAAAPAPAPAPAPVTAQVAPTPPASASVPVPVTARIYNGGDAQVSPPVIVRQDLPPFPRDMVTNGRPGVLEVIIGPNGLVESAVMRTAINPRYDTLVLSATKVWRFKPATVGGTPVKFRKMISINIKQG